MKDEDVKGSHQRSSNDSREGPVGWSSALGLVSFRRPSALERPGRVVDTLFMRRSIIVASLLTLWACGSQAPLGLTPYHQSSKEAARSHISQLRFHSSRSSAGLISPLFAESTASVVCSLSVSGLRPGTKIAVRWQRSGQVLATNNLVTTRDTRTLWADLSSDAPLGSGTFEVAVLIRGNVEASGSFRIAGQPEPQRPTTQDPRVFDLTLASGDDECIPESTGRQPSAATFTGNVNAVHICLQYEYIRRGQQLEVRWYQSSSSRQPLAVTSYSPTGSGDLSASYAHDDGVQPGSYHVAVVLDGREQGRVRFTVRP